MDILDNIGSSKIIVDALMCHLVFGTKAFIPAAYYLSELLRSSDLGYSKKYPPKKRTSYLILPFPELRKNNKACHVLHLRLML